MQNDLTVINKIYKPHKYIIKGKAIILYCDNKDIVLKPKCKSLISTYHYLDARGFTNYVPYIDNLRKDYDVFPYIIENNISYQQKGYDLGRVSALLHAKTSYNKEVDKEVFDNLYYDILNNLNYIEDYYSKLYDEIFLYKYHKPHEIMFIDYYSKINNAIGFCKKELESWYMLVSNKKSQRISLIHNNLKVDHLLKADDDYLISFDNARFDTPVLDLVTLYKNEYDNLNFYDLFQNYLYHFNYNDDEKTLFFILISMPYEIKFNTDNANNIRLISELCNYIDKTEDLVRPYYSSDEKEEKG